MIGADTILSLYIILVGIGLGIPIVAVAGGRASGAIKALAWIAAADALLASAIMVYATNASGALSFFGGQVIHDSFTSFIVFAGTVAATLALMAAGDEPLIWESSPGYYGLLPFVLFGLFVLSGANDVLVVLASWLLLSVLSYVYIALPVERESRAAAVRYILMGGVATLFLVIWVAGNTSLSTMENLAQFASATPYSIAPLTSLGISGLLLAALLAAIGFKTGIVPFHWWLPSVYGRADGRVVSIVAGVVKLGFLALLARLVYSLSGAGYTGVIHLQAAEAAPRLAAVLAVLAVATMTYGNIAALTTNDLRALLSYSSIAQVGYILAALAALAYLAPKSPGMVRYALAAVAVQAAAYGIAKAPLFSLTTTARSMREVRGLLGRDKAAGAGAAILLFSLLGMPPMLGFWGKLYMFIAVAKYSVLLVLAAFINSAISSAYYVRMARELAAEDYVEEVEVPREVSGALILGALLLVILGLLAPILFSVAY